MNVLKFIGRSVLWIGQYLLWTPLKWTATTGYKFYGYMTADYKSSSTLSKVQQAAAKDLPNLTKKLTALEAEKKKLADKWQVANTEAKAVAALIKAAGGDFGQHPKPVQHNNRNSKNNGNSNNNNGNNNNGNTQNNGNNRNNSVESIETQLQVAT